MGKQLTPAPVGSGCGPRSQLKGKICLVSGASTGIGKAAALELARIGATVVLLCREEIRGRSALRDVQAHGEAHLVVADLSVQREVRRAAGEILGRFDSLHVLINNAATSIRERTLTEEGFEKMFATNHLGPFLLTNLLLDRLRASASSRVITMSSTVHRWQRLDVNDLQSERNYQTFRVYCRNKLANTLFTMELARRTAGSGVTAYCMHPGFVRTELFRNSERFDKLFINLLRPFMISPVRVAAALAYLASDPTIENYSGGYFHQRKLKQPSAQARDPALAKTLWRLSEELTGLA